MLKKYSPIDLSFLLFCFLFGLVFLYEFIKFITPHYTFGRFFILFILVSFLFVGYKNNFKFPKIQSKINNTFRNNTKAKTNMSSISLVDRDFTKVKQSITFVKNNRDFIAYGSFIIASGIILIGMLFDTGKIVPWALGFFALIFLCMKSIGFQIETQIYKSRVSNSHTLKLFIVSFAVFFIIMKLICDSFALPEDERGMIYIGFSFLYIIGGFLTFFKYSFSLARTIRPYNILSMLLVVALVSLLGYNNGLGDMIKEKIVEKTMLVEEMNLPGIISDEVEITQEELKEIEYEQVLVVDTYDIEAGLSLGSTGEGVSSLQTVLGNLQYFIGEVSGNFDEDTKGALTDALITECDWPESTRGIFGPQAKECIDSLEISIPKK